MAPRYAACSAGSCLSPALLRKRSAPITIRCSNPIAGRPICGFARFRKSRQCRMCRYPIRSSNGPSAQFVESFWTTCLSGQPLTSSGSSVRSVTTTTKPARIDRLLAQRRSRPPKGAACRSQSNGNDIAEVCTSCQSRRDQEFAPDTTKARNAAIDQMATTLPRSLRAANRGLTRKSRPTGMHRAS